MPHSVQNLAYVVKYWRFPEYFRPQTRLTERNKKDQMSLIYQRNNNIVTHAPTFPLKSTAFTKYIKTDFGENPIIWQNTSP